MNLNAVLDHPLARLLGRLIVWLGTVAAGIMAIIVGSVGGYTAIVYLVATIVSGGEESVRIGPLWLGCSIAAGMLVTYGITTLVKMVVRLISGDLILEPHPWSSRG